jgi:hypothetical protein
MKRLIKKSVFARQQGISKSRVSQLLKIGIIMEEANGKLDEAKCSARLREYRNRRPQIDLRNFDFGDLEKELKDRGRVDPQGACPSLSPARR